MHRGRPSPRHQERVAGHGSPRAGDIQSHRLNPQAPFNAQNLGPRRDLDSRGARGFGQRLLGVWAQIGDQRDADARLLQVQRGAVGAVVRGRDDNALADLHAMLIAIAPRGICKHHRRPVVVREDERALDRACRQHHLARSHLPQALARQVGIGDEVSFGDALVQRDEILCVIAERLRARHQPDIRRRAQRGDRVLEPSQSAFPLDLGLSLGEQRAA